MATALSNIDYALLGLLARGAATGYDVRKVFQSTPLGSYSDSPGSIYPALARLERNRLLTAQSERHGRRRRTLRLTAKGAAALKAWIAMPVRVEELERGRGSVALRLAFISDVTPARLRPFLAEYNSALSAHHRALTAAGKLLSSELSPSGQLALAAGIDTCRAQGAWCRRILKERA